jgi:hypothetical protein
MDNNTSMINRLLTLCCVILALSCARSPDFSDIPQIEFRGFSRDTLIQGEFNDSTFVQLFFTDGDGDFGASTTSNSANIFFKDLRTGIINQYKAPFIPVQGANNGVSGKINILLRSTCCIYPAATGIPPCEVVAEYPSNLLSYEIFIEDRAGHKSNIVSTPTLALQCR